MSFKFRRHLCKESLRKQTIADDPHSPGNKVVNFNVAPPRFLIGKIHPALYTVLQKN